jgi:hypothetical protein
VQIVKGPPKPKRLLVIEEFVQTEQVFITTIRELLEVCTAAVTSSRFEFFLSLSLSLSLSPRVCVSLLLIHVPFDRIELQETATRIRPLNRAANDSLLQWIC